MSDERRKQIEKAKREYAKTHSVAERSGFRDGAVWADEHPSKENDAAYWRKKYQNLAIVTDEDVRALARAYRKVVEMFVEPEAWDKMLAYEIARRILGEEA